MTSIGDKFFGAKPPNVYFILIILNLETPLSLNLVLKLFEQRSDEFLYSEKEFYLFIYFGLKDHFIYKYMG